jgi:hypothetical protein
MHKMLAIFFIAINLFGNTEFGQISKLPQLFVHFNQHRKANAHLSFVQFLAMHFAGDDGTTADDNEDMKLPCHNPNHTCLSFVLAFTKYIEPGVSTINYEDGINYGSLLQNFKPGHYLVIILQPPRTA